MAEPSTMITIFPVAYPPNPNYCFFDILFNNTCLIFTTVTSDPRMLSDWLSNISSASLIGLDTEWSPNYVSQRLSNPFLYTLQLCTTSDFSTTCCLIFQFHHCLVPLPTILFDFLDDESITFVGVGIRRDAELLSAIHGLKVRNVVDLSDLITDKVQGAPKGLRLHELALVVLNVNVAKPNDVTLSMWGNRLLSDQQIQYACMDAFLPYEIGKILISFPSITETPTSNTN